MPLTLAHPAVMLPLRRSGLPMSALVLGSMVPDVPLFLGAHQLYPITHSAVYPITHSAVGVLTVDVIAVMVGLVLWFGVVADAVLDLAPTAIRTRCPAHLTLTTRQWWLTPVGGVIGAASHVAWDAFTHVDGSGTARVTWLQQDHAGIAGYVWAQYLSGVIGLAVVCGYAGWELARRPVLRDRAVDRSRMEPWTMPTMIGTSVTAGGVVAATQVSDGLLIMAYDAVVTSIATAVVLTLTVAVIWQMRGRRAA